MFGPWNRQSQPSPTDRCFFSSQPQASLMKALALSRDGFSASLEAKVLVDRCRRHYNQVRPHSALGYRRPAPEAIEPVPPGSGPLRQPALAEEGILT